MKFKLHLCYQKNVKKILKLALDQDLLGGQTAKKKETHKKLFVCSFIFVFWKKDRLEF